MIPYREHDLKSLCYAIECQLIFLYLKPTTNESYHFPAAQTLYKFYTLLANAEYPTDFIQMLIIFIYVFEFRICLLQPGIHVRRS